MCSCLLIDERPEEVTDFQRSVKAEGRGVLQRPGFGKRTCGFSRFMIERLPPAWLNRARMFFVLLDSITRVASRLQQRSRRQWPHDDRRCGPRGALEIPRKMFASARQD